MKKKCKWCPNLIPDTRKGDSEYCSDKCYNEAKKKRSQEQYQLNKAFREQIKRSEDILANLYSLSVLRKVWTFDDLQKLQFDFTISTGQLAGKKGEFWTVVGNHAYYIDPETKNVHIWKRPSK
jgi:hypothetical protein